MKDTDLGLPYWNWLANRTIPDLWENIPSKLKEWKKLRNDPLGYANIQDLLNGYRIRGCQSSSSNFGEVVLRINKKNVDVIPRSKLYTAMGRKNFRDFADGLQVKNPCLQSKYFC